MDQSDQAKAEATVLARALETIGEKLQRERGLTGEQVALAMLATGLNGLSKVWSGQQVVDHLAGVTGALMEVHGIQPTGEVTARGRPN